MQGLRLQEKEHEAARLLLPWYVNETLADRDEELVLRHLANCESCQVERDRLYELKQLVQESDGPLVDSEASFRNTWQRIKAAEKNRSSVSEVDRHPVARRWLPASIAAGVLLLAGLVGLQYRQGQGGEYQALTSGQAGAGKMHRMELGFEHPIPAVTLRKALIETGSNIVSGPDKKGIYVVEIRLDNSTDETGYLARLRQIEGVTHAAFIAR